MPPRTHKRRRKYLSEQIARLAVEWQAVIEQISRTLNSADKIRLQRQADDLNKQIEVLETELDKLDRPRHTTPHHLVWQANLPEINFRKALEWFNVIDEELNRCDGGAATFLMPDSFGMGGKLCLSRLKKNLETMERPPYVVDFFPGKRLDVATFLREMGRHLGYEVRLADDHSPSELTSYTNEIIRRLISSVCYGSVVLLELHVWNPVGLHDSFLPQFLQYFWHPLLENMPSVTHDYPLVKFLSLIVVYPSLAEARLPEHLCCQPDHFDSRKLLELPLQPWTKDEIRLWLYRYVGPMATKLGHTRTEMDNLAQFIFDMSNGRPKDVQALLQEHLPSFFVEEG